MITLVNIRPKGFNIGNDAINVALREMLHGVFGRVVNIIEVPATSTYESNSRAGLTAKVIHEINRVADGVVIGGGNLYENNELTVDLNALRALQVPLMLFSVSRGRIYNRHRELIERTDVMPDDLLRGLHRPGTYSLARDSATLDHLHAVGCSQAKFGGCPTIWLSEIPDRLPVLPEREFPGALISIRTPSLMNIPSQLQGRVQRDIEGVIDLLRKKGYKRVRILCNDSRDVDFATMFRATKQVDFLYTSDVYLYLSLLARAELLVSYRLHASLPAHSFGVPSIDICYDERALSLFSDLGLGAHCIDMVQRDNVPDAVAEKLENKDELLAAANALKPGWQEIRHIQERELSNFAADVTAYARS